MPRDNDSEGFDVPADSVEVTPQPSSAPEPVAAKKPAKAKKEDHTRDDHKAPQVTGQEIVAMSAHMREIFRGRRIADKARRDPDVAYLVERIEQLEKLKAKGRK